MSHAESSSPTSLPSVRAAETIGRAVIAGSLVALAYALWTPNLETAATWTEKELLVLPRMTVFGLAGLIALILQGARPNGKMLAWFGFGMLALNIWLLRWVNFRIETSFQLHPTPIADVVMNLLRFELAIMAAVVLGIWLGQKIRTPAHFITLLLCAIAGDVWVTGFGVPESVDPTHVLSLLRMPWPPDTGHLGACPAFMDLLVLSAIIEAVRALRLHLSVVIMGALAGYCGAAFLALEPWPACPWLSMFMCSCGVLISCWPDLKCTFYNVGVAILISASLLALLWALSAMRSKLYPPPPNHDDGKGEGMPSRFEVRKQQLLRQFAGSESGKGSREGRFGGDVGNCIPSTQTTKRERAFEIIEENASGGEVPQRFSNEGFNARLNYRPKKKESDANRRENLQNHLCPSLNPSDF
ncbi:MAG: hypothetical protein V1899_00580 [Planctomycetota bacterium]